jgi:uncharacterized protein (DUF427 family)
MNTKLPEWVKEAQEQWRYRGQERPPFVVDPHPGQESVWDYPRPPKIQLDQRHIVVRANGQTIVDTQSTYRVLETASPPVFYIPPHEVNKKYLLIRTQSSFCEWKGIAQYWGLNVNGCFLENVAWTYLNPFSGFESIAGHFTFYPHRIEC